MEYRCEYIFLRGPGFTFQKYADSRTNTQNIEKETAKTDRPQSYEWIKVARVRHIDTYTPTDSLWENSRALKIGRKWKKRTTGGLPECKKSRALKICKPHKIACPVCGRHTLKNESCHTYEWVMSHAWMSHVTLNWLSHVRTTQLDQKEWVMISHVWMSRFIHVME